MPENAASGPITTLVSAEKIWAAAQVQLRSMLSADTFNLWFAPLHASTLENDCIFLDVANDFCEVWLKDNYMGLLQDVLSRAATRPMQVKFKVITANTLSNPATAHAKQSKPDASTEKAMTEPGFNPKNTFDSFVVGNNNNFAHAAAFAV